MNGGVKPSVGPTPYRARATVYITPAILIHRFAEVGLAQRAARCLLGLDPGSLLVLVRLASCGAA